MTWSVLHIIGIIAYAASGAFVALQAKYSFIGIFVLGLTTSFGGAVIRNIVLDVPISSIWDRQSLLIVLITLTTIVIVNRKWVNHWKRWGYFFDSIGLASFAIQGGLLAKSLQHDLGIIVIASMFTGVGGGMVRDLLAGRPPLALKEEIHAILTFLCAVCIWSGWSSPIELTTVVVFVVFIRMYSIHNNWRLELPCNRIEKQ
ncbi:trimeric intracellular cation channel family protein [Bacillus salipaludis]|uniref:Trimeric intracellular cation channel family protein n=1 Tax=Bacillus salipaludis TaxID=2547811 RepID=A0AA90R943_9BACI|nr:trimeric intracellular cation channel family protein [Bacillus salipaludis]MDQ6599103.1 trimeric intracellular cation channel family protein [Bacillus salipaludis]